MKFTPSAEKKGPASATTALSNSSAPSLHVNPNPKTTSVIMPIGAYRGELLSTIPTSALETCLLLPTLKAGASERLELAIAAELAARRGRRAA